MRIHYYVGVIDYEFILFPAAVFTFSVAELVDRDYISAYVASFNARFRARVFVVYKLKLLRV